ncbi:MAG TPA: type IX secretion system membrane protein PorP/SprF [Prolixibacteraceae bacterium]|nr:type IX secretion system membrane protein PorP/SprF [Prolixibacteraceae bacterium]
MKKIISFLFFVLIINLAAFSQIDPQFTNNMHYKLGVNPGYAGAEDAINGIILNRYQWEGMPGAAKTLVFSADAAISAFGAPGGIGINILNDQLGFEQNIAINANYAYQAELGIGKLGIGVSFGFYNKTLNGEWEIPEDNMYTQPGSDPLIPQGEVSQVAGDVGAGLYLSANKYYLGLSITHINEASIKFEELEAAYLPRHYYLMGGYNISLPDPLFELRPSFLFKTDAAAWQMDINANLVFDDRFWGGISYRVQDAVALLMGLEMGNGLKVGYSFDLVTSSIGYYGWGSHEIFVSYSLNLERNRNQKYKSIRFL